MKYLIQISILTLFISSETLSQVAYAEERNLSVSLQNGEIAQQDKTFRFRKGDRVTIRWTSDAPLELHLHGYNVTTKVGPDAVATTSFVAHTPGRFPVERHGHEHGHAKPGRKLQLGKADSVVFYIEVHP